MSADLLSEIKAVTKDFMERFASGDMKRLSEIYTEDCRFMPAGQDTIIGREGSTDFHFTCVYIETYMYMLDGCMHFGALKLFGVTSLAHP